MRQDCALYLHLNDLRLIDNRPLSLALDRHDTVYGLAVVDPTWFGENEFGFLRMSDRRVAWYLEALHDLRAAYEAKGGGLIIRHGGIIEEVHELCRTLGVSHLYAQDAKTTYEKRVLADLEIALSQQVCTWVWNDILIDPERLPTPANTFPRSFSGFRKKFEQKCNVPRPLAAPKSLFLPPIDLGQVPSLSALGRSESPIDARSPIVNLVAGESAAWQQIEAYIWSNRHIEHYKETRNGMLNWADSSKFSLYLSTGTLSPRSLYHEIRAFEEEIVENQSTYWLKYELFWREYFHALATFCQDRLFFRNGVRNRYLPWRSSSDEFLKWTRGETGCPIVDACMRELSFTGYCSNRGRQLVASYFVKYLGLDWRFGAAWFEHHLIDYDPCSNWGNWQYLAGVGTDAQDRTFSMQKQAERYDASAHFVKRWIPEISDVSSAELLLRNPIGPEAL